MEDVDGFTEYAQNHLRVAQVLFKHCMLYISLKFMQSWKSAENKFLMQLESHTESTDRRMEGIEGDVHAMMGLLQIFISLPQITSILTGFIHLVDTTYRKHPVSMSMASSFEVRFYA